MKKNFKGIAIVSCCLLALASLASCVTTGAAAEASKTDKAAKRTAAVSLAGSDFDEYGDASLEGISVKFLDEKNCTYVVHYEPPVELVDGTYTVDEAAETVTLSLSGKWYYNIWEDDSDVPVKQYACESEGFEGEITPSEIVFKANEDWSVLVEVVGEGAHAPELFRNN